MLPRKPATFRNMSTAQLIAELKALPARERARVIEAAAPVPKPKAGLRSKPALPRRVTWPDLAEMKKKVFGGRRLPNLVLLEREEAPC